MKKKFHFFFHVYFILLILDIFVCKELVLLDINTNLFFSLFTFVKKFIQGMFLMYFIHNAFNLLSYAL